MSQEYLEKFQISGESVVRVDNVSGSVTVRPGPDGEVTVHAVRHGREKEGSQVEIGQNADGSVYAKSETRRSDFSFFLFTGERAPKVDFTVTMPAGGKLKVRTVNAITNVSGITGVVDLKAVNGDIIVSDIAGELVFKTVNGDIRGSRVGGAAELTTVNGTIALEEADLPSLSARTVSGDIALETPVGEGPYQLRTVSGHVRIASSGEVNGKVHYRTVSGSVRMNGERLDSLSYGPGKRSIALGSGGPDIYFKSVSGSLELAGESFAEMKRSPSEKKDTSESGADFMEVLDRISRGELSVDEGISSLQH